MSKNSVLIETFGYCGRRKLVNIPDGGLRLHISAAGAITELKPQNFCKICNGSGGATFFFDRDDKRGVACPRCNGGTQERWDLMHHDWNKHNRLLR